MSDMEQFEQDMRDGKLRPIPGKYDGDGNQEFYERTSWSSVDLEPYKRGDKVIDPPAFLPRDDGQCLVYAGRPHIFYGQSESLKTWCALLACKSFLEAGLAVVYVDLENSEAQFVDWSRFVGIQNGYIGNALTYIHPMQKLEGNAVLDFTKELEDAQPALVVLDGVSELYALQDWNINDATDAANFHRTFAFHRRGEVASIAIDHTAKDAGRGVLGSQHKRAGLDGAEFEFTAVQHGGRGKEGVSKVRVTKDRHGYVREFAAGSGANPVVATLHVGPDTVTLRAPTMGDYLGEDKLEETKRGVRSYLKDNPGSSKNQLEKNVRGGVQLIRDALEALITTGEVENAGTDKRGSWSLKDSSSEETESSSSSSSS
jgi:hypothetical protein